MSVIVCLATCPDNATAIRLGEVLVEQRLAACVNIVPGVRSVYRWEGRVTVDDEVVLIIKTTAARLDALTEQVRQLHPYAVPALVALPIAGGLPEYLQWIEAGTAPGTHDAFAEP
ncbi:divalent-cation tolerance protein CutA [Luteimonas deserti]|uniref:Divalent-cation tolerance protein CutA n=1 Tax=Luteimonas deserti TaxID=2752306 RepID=A0A7Z0TTT3_9GAMM|nr:divalent-cation tolerance protein CutA [Luteimonas deserti]NYZ62136.1 divalent-cation tolerance protein CutA [Luteimonas deserti]